jgi:signal transduction histidine kinase
VDSKCTGERMQKKNSILKSQLSQRVLAYILLCSSIFSICSTTVQLYVDYRYDLKALEARFKVIEQSHIPSMATSLWDFNRPLVEQQIQGVVNLKDIKLVKVITDFGDDFSFGNKDVVATRLVEYPIFFGEKNEIGKLQVYANYDDIYESLSQKAAFIIMSEFIKIFIVSLVIIFIVHLLITRHIFRITDYSRQLGTDNLNEGLYLVNRSRHKDELDYLVDAINDMRLKLKADIVKLESAENSLTTLNAELEGKVLDRTKKLAESNLQLQDSLDDLTLAKNQLVQSEKMASLGQLVAGVAHEVNTPLGISVTSVTALKEKLDDLSFAVQENKLTKSLLVKNLNTIEQYQQIIERSLNKSVELIQSFKSVAVEQHTDPKLKINLAQHVKDVVNTVKTMFKHKQYTINMVVNKNFNFVSFPSAWNQILTNFLMNSHLHGFEDKQEGVISIVFLEDDEFLTLTYTDNGKGLSEEVKDKVFDPFVTTKRGCGGTGLGLNIVFNLIDSKLGGTVKVVEVEQGCCFEVRVPINIPQKTSAKDYSLL